SRGRTPHRGALAAAQPRIGAAVIDLTRGAPAAIKMTGDTLRRLLSPAFPAAETERRINRECPAAGGHFALANSPAVERLAAGALAATQLAGVEPHQRRPQSSRQGALRDVAPTCPAGAMMLLIPWRVVAAESVAAKIDRRAPPISVLMMSGRRRSMELAPFAATGTLHIAGAVSELAS